MINIQTFGPSGGNILYKALSHPLAVGPLLALEKDLSGRKIAFYDPDHYLPTLTGLYPGLVPSVLLTHDTEQVGQKDGYGGIKTALVNLPGCGVDAVLALSFEKAKMQARLGDFLGDHPLYTLEEARLPESFLPVRRPYLDKLNFATNFAFFRDDDRFSTRLVTANYWSSYGADLLRYWFRLFDEKGRILVEWEQEFSEAGAGILIDSAEIRQRFDLPPFTGQLFIHVIGACGHDVVKYALDTYGRNGNPSLSVTHDANAWPSMRFATLPAPCDDEKVILWIQNSHGTSIPKGAISLNPMGEEVYHPVMQEIGPYESLAVDVGALVPGLSWPAQLELRAGRHLVRPRYEIMQNGRTRIAHLNVERDNLKPEPALRTLSPALGRGFILPFPVLDPEYFETFIQPTPMSEALQNLPVRLDIFDDSGQKQAEHFLGNLPRNHHKFVAVHELTRKQGHADLVYDFRDGGEGDGWLHALMRYQSRQNGHAAETSFGAHIFNTVMTWRSEPQSYSGPPPGLTTRLFLKLGQKLDGKMLESFSFLIHPASLEKGKPSRTILYLHHADGRVLAEQPLSIPASGSFMVRPHLLFSRNALEDAGEGGYVLIRDLNCRLFGYHGVEDGQSGFSLDHMFGF